jgi:hypothetical protein
MSIKSIIKAGLLTASLVAITAPALAQLRDNDRPRDERDGNGRGGENRAPRGGDNAGGRGGGGGENRGPRGGDNGGGRGGEARPAPVAVAAPTPAPAPVVRVAPPVAPQTADNGRFQRGGNEQPRPGTPQWNGQRGATPQPAADRNNAGEDRGRNQGSGQANAGRDRGNNDGRGGNWNRDNNGRDNNARDNNWNRDRDGRDNNWRGNDGRSGNWNNGRPGVRPPVANRWDGMRRWDNNSWRNDRRYDWRDWRNAHRNIFRLPSYRAPYGWNRSYSRFSIGIYLDSILFGSDYWIDDPWSYRLPPVYGTLRWVRYYDDAMLIDVRDGYVVDVIYDFFW